MLLDISNRQVGDIEIIDVKGRFTNGNNADKLRDEIKKLVSVRRNKIILNLSEVDYIDATGIGVLVSSYTSIYNSGGKLRLSPLKGKVEDLIRFTGLYNIFYVQTDEAAAIRSF